MILSMGVVNVTNAAKKPLQITIRLFSLPHNGVTSAPWSQPLRATVCESKTSECVRGMRGPASVAFHADVHTCLSL